MQPVRLQSAKSTPELAASEELKRLLTVTNLTHKEAAFARLGTEYSALLESTDEDLKELLMDAGLNLKIGDRQAIVIQIRKEKDSLSGGSGDGGGPGSSRGGKDSLEMELDGFQNSSEIQNFQDIKYDARSGYLSKGVSGSVYKVRRMPSWPRSWANFSLL
jgi:hypothetical protein